MLDRVNKDASIKELRIEIGEHVLVDVSLKQMDGKMFIDLRKWYKYGELTEFFPSKKGIMLPLDTWKDVIIKLNEFISDSSSMVEAKEAA